MQTSPIETSFSALSSCGAGWAVGGGGGAFKDRWTSNYREFSVSETCFYIRITVDTYLQGR